jgi:hypothetical protein
MLSTREQPNGSDLGRLLISPTFGSSIAVARF